MNPQNQDQKVVDNGGGGPENIGTDTPTNASMTTISTSIVAGAPADQANNG